MFEKNHDILLHPKGATTMPTGIKVLVCDDDAAFCQKMADLVRRNQPEDGSSVAVTICCGCSSTSSPSQNMRTVSRVLRYAVRACCT